ncbi:DUF4391 domain-containing protein [Verminephrobacter eiseniae]|uniref:DUF4391 domain-containing protein n=1 Tax=Verminephrobacter eiseniae TaxID=364317 RepID=UPI0022380229|nr:DUF4391 domain-containing protein [Verminephrobacter eiseniae]MCW5237801.1 DUF4391 domain-containing protein [Verminephrobacter eiseniae]
MSSSFISYPKQAVVGRPLPKSKIYQHSRVNQKLKDLFVDQIEQIIWQYKLAPETINLPTKPGVLEIQVFAIQLKTPTLHSDVLRCIDGAIPHPIIFELSFDGNAQTIAAYKRQSESDPKHRVLSDYFATPWQPGDTPRSAMPVALDLAGLYEQILQRLIPLPRRPQENLATLLARVEQVKVKQRAIEKTASQLGREKQFNRKVEINARLRQLQQDLQGMMQ